MIRPSSYRAGGGLELAPAVLLITRTVLIIMVIITTVDAGASSGSLLAAPDATSASQNNRQLLNHLPDGFQCAIETCWAEHLDNGELLQDRICCRASYDGNNCPVGA